MNKNWVCLTITHMCHPMCLKYGGYICCWVGGGGGGGASSVEDVPLVEFKYIACNRMPGDSYRRLFGSVLLLCPLSYA